MLTLSPAASNILTHRILNGDFTEVCACPVCELAARGLWTDHIRISILRDHGPYMLHTRRRHLLTCIHVHSLQTILDIAPDVNEQFMTPSYVDRKGDLDLAATATRS